MVPERQMAFDDQPGLNGDVKRSDMNAVCRRLMVSVTFHLRWGKRAGKMHTSPHSLCFTARDLNVGCVAARSTGFTARQ